MTRLMLGYEGMMKDTPKQIIERYITGVQAGAIPASRAIRQAVDRHVRDLADGPARGLHFDEKAATRVIQFFRLSTALERRVGR